MKAKVTGMTTWQDTPTSGTLRIWPAERYEDGSGNATPGRYDFALNVDAKAWRDEHNSAADAYVVVAAPGEPEPVLALFEETFLYANGARVVHIYRRLLVASDLNGTEYNYVTPQSVVTYTGSDPLSLQAARQLLLDGNVKLAAMDTALAAANQTHTEIQAVQTRLAPFSGNVYPGGSYWQGISTAWGWDDPTGRPWLFFDPLGKAYIPGGLDSSSLVDVRAVRVGVTAATDVFVNGFPAIPIIEDMNGRVPMALRFDGVMDFPGGIAAPNLAAALGFLTDDDGGVRINNVRMVTRKNLVAIGDSMTAPGYGDRLAALLGTTSYNRGVGSQNSAEIAARVDAGPALYANVTGASIPANGGVTVDMVAIDVLRNAGNQSMKVTLAGISGTLSRVGNVNANPNLLGYTFTRTTAGAVVAVTNPVQVIPDMAVTEDCVALIRIGRNDVPYADAVDRVLDGVRRIIARLAPAKKRFLVIDVFTATTEGTDATGNNLLQRQRVLAINEAFRKEWPANYAPLRAHIVALGGAANDTITAVQSPDTIHVTGTVDQQSAVFLAQLLREKGWYV